MKNRWFAALLVPLATGACSQRSGVDGVDGSPGSDGAPGADGVSCWDLNGNGTGDGGEDANGDGTWTAADCAGASAAGVAKAAVYVVVARAEAAPYEAVASCRDETDILLNGGCTAGDDKGEEYAPQVSFGPVNADAPDAPAGFWCWYSAATGESHWLEATASCLAVD